MEKPLKNKCAVLGLILLFSLISYNVLYFAIPFNRNLSNTSFWITYSFTTIIHLASFFMIIVGLKDKQLKSRVFGLPIVILAIFVLVFQLVFDVIIMAVGNWYYIAYWIPVVVEIITTAFFAIAFIVRNTYKNYINTPIVKTDDMAFIKNLRKELETIYNSVTDLNLRIELNRLVEAARYSIPQSTPEVHELEESISDVIRQLKNHLDDGNHAKVILSIHEAINLLKERKLALTK